MRGHGTAGTHPSGPRATLPRVLRAEALRLRRSPLVPLHLACALAAGAACGAYFAYVPWDTAMGADAFMQLLGAMMPLMAGIVCGLDADAEGEATGLANLLSVPSRHRALVARLLAIWLMGILALALAVITFTVPLTLAGRQALVPATLVGTIVGLAFGSAPLYLLIYAVALRWGRNVAIATGTVGLMLAFFSVGGLAHGLMTGELTAAGANALSYLPTSWPALLGSLPVELAIADGSAGTAQVASVASRLGSLCALCGGASVLFAGAAMAWISRFEPVQRGN